MFAALYAHAYRLRGKLGLTREEALEAWISVLSNGGMIAVAFLSLALALIGHATGSLAVTVSAGYIYSAIGVFEYAIGEYGGRQRKRLAATS